VTGPTTPRPSACAALPALQELRQIARPEELAAALHEIQERVAAAVQPGRDAGDRLGELDEELLRSERLVGRAWKVMMRDQLVTIRAAWAARRG
jgi:hypothetical protein